MILFYCTWALGEKKKKKKEHSGVLPCLICVWGVCFKCVYEHRAFSTPSSIHSVHPPLTSSVLVAEVREAPHVAQADDGAGHRQDELYLVAPLAPLLHLLLRGRQQVLGAIAEVCFGSVSCRRGGRGEGLLQKRCSWARQKLWAIQLHERSKLVLL